MSQATDYALRLTRSPGFAWSDFARDVRDGAFATARLVVTLAGCTALLAVAAVASNEEARGQLAEFMPRNLPFMSAPEAGPVDVEDWATVGGLTAVHQFVRVGAHSFVGGCSAVVMDVPPFVSASGNRAKLYGLNVTGLRRRGFDEETISDLRRAYRDVFQSGDVLAQALERVRGSPGYGRSEVRCFVEFIAASERGVTR